MYLGVTDLTQGLDRSSETCSSVKRIPAIKKTSDESVIGGNLFGRVFFLDCPNYGVQFRIGLIFLFPFAEEGFLDPFGIPLDHEGELV